VLKSRFPAIIAELPLKMDLIAREAADLVEQRAKDRVPVQSGKLRYAIHVQREGAGEYGVVAGNDDVFYGHIVEHGGARTPAHPFLIPAADESRVEIQTLAIAILKGL
jgi:HK97 gp10 family phage protein